ncbi:hypothetical protein NC315_25020 [Streptomyces sp. G2]|uniref:hypothetical protein n=1 Tax=Streptomyces sp. G2 TaxID=1684471 RepID=UPI00203092CB|nr:hypothetical protein [Streptomyces sp. G2]MCM1948610.1 hypothetical protein [Streptomyces sp. G2]
MNPATPAAEVMYHFVLTIRIDDGSTVTDAGTVPLKPGAHTRVQILDALRASMLQRLDLTACSVLFFALEPNTL